MRRATDITIDGGELPTQETNADADTMDVESVMPLLNSSVSPTGSPWRMARLLPVALAMLLLLSAASVLLYSVEGLPNGFFDEPRESNTLHATTSSALDLPARAPEPSMQNLSSTAVITTYTEEVTVPRKRLAYMFYVTSDIYGCAALHLMDKLVHGVKMDASRIDLVVLHSPSVSQHTLDNIKAVVPVRLIMVESIRADAIGDTWLESLTKLNAFKEWGYDRVVYMDADAVPMQNLDHLFDLPSAPLYAPSAYWLPQPFFASTLMVIEPSNSEFDAIIAWARQQGAAAGYDMDILNKYFSKSVKYLSGDYTVLNSDFRAKPDAKNTLHETTTELKRQVKLVHFSCKPDGSYGKPWTAGSHNLGDIKKKGFDPLFAELFEAYWKTEAEKCK